MGPTSALEKLLKGIPALLLSGLLAGCMIAPLEKARSEFYAGRFDRAETALIPLPETHKDQVLFLMERGMARQALGKYEESARDWRDASERNELLETHSASRGAASMLTNDRVLSFRGKPYERTLLFAFLAKNYLAEQNWDYAAICARNIIQQLENRGGFPDSAYSRYMAGFCLEMIGDTGNAAMQYRIASDLVPGLYIDEHTGLIFPDPDAKMAEPFTAHASDTCQFVCFVAMGRAAPSSTTPPADTAHQSVYADFYSANDYLGRSHLLDNTWDLAEKTRKHIELLQLTKDVSRVAIKETIAQTVDEQSETLGFLTRLTLFAVEMPDTRAWLTLPHLLCVARLPCPKSLTGYTVVFKDANEKTTLVKKVSNPISRRGNIFISFCRDIPDTQCVNRP